MANDFRPIIPLEEACRFIKDCVSAAGACAEAAEGLARMTVSADAHGLLGHGMQRLEKYLEDIQAGLCDPNASPSVVHESPSTAWVNGNNCLGTHIGAFCMEKAIQKAKKTGIGWVTCNNANPNGIESYYSMMAMNEGMIGLALSNGPPAVVPTRAREPALGANPICMGAPGKDPDHFLLDMSTANTSVAKLHTYRHLGRHLPQGWAVDEEGRGVTDPEVACEKPYLLPLGGTEEQAGYKGTGLGLMVEILCGICAGSNYGPFVPKEAYKDQPYNLGQCYIAVNPACFAPGFQSRLTHLLQCVRKLPAADPQSPVLIPGDLERQALANVEAAGGLRYDTAQLERCARLASKYGILPMKDIDGHVIGMGGTGGYVCKAGCGIK